MDQYFENFLATCHENVIIFPVPVHFQVASIKKTLKTTQQQDVEEQMVTDSRDVVVQPEKPTKKASKTKG